MNELISEFLGFLANQLYDTLSGVLNVTLEQSLRIETYASEVLSASIIASVYDFLYIFACAVMAMKFMQRGFSIYILWRDDDADSSPRDMVTGVITGVVVAVSFPFLYGKLADVIIWVYNNLVILIGTGAPGITSMPNITGIVNTIFYIIYIVATFVLWLQMLKRGFELLILRMGIPIACVGFVNSDNGIFRSYMSMVFKSAITLMVQAVLLSVSFKLTTSSEISGIIVGLSALMSAFSIPTLFQQFLAPGGGGGNVINKVYSTARAAQSVRGMFK